MGRKRLLMNRFAECILADYENFSFKYETGSINDKISKNYIELKKYAEVLRML